MSELPDRPASLKRAPRPAADEATDPVDYVAPVVPALSAKEPSSPLPSSKPGPEPSIESSVAEDERANESANQTVSFAQVPRVPTGRPGRPRNREITANFSTQLAIDVHDLIDTAVDAEGITKRAVVEQAIRKAWGHLA